MVTSQLIICRVDLRRHLSKRLGVDLLAEFHSQRLVLLVLQAAHLVGDLPDPRHSVVVRLRDLDRFGIPPLVDDLAPTYASSGSATIRTRSEQTGLLRGIPTSVHSPVPSLSTLCMACVPCTA